MTFKSMAIQALAKVKNPRGRLDTVAVGERFVPTQTFHAMQGGRAAPVAVVYIPGFSGVPLLGAKGAIGQVAQEHAADFSRFYHPDLLVNPQSLTYARMVDESAAVIKAMPNGRVVLAASSFGAGILPFVIRKVQQEQPKKIAGVFGFVAAPPEALVDLFQQQKGWDTFHTTGELVVHSKTLPKPFPMTHKQYDGIAAHRYGRSLSLNLDVPVYLMCGKTDSVALPTHSYNLAAKLSPNAIVTEVDAGHSLPADKIAHGLRWVLHNAKMVI